MRVKNCSSMFWEEFELGFCSDFEFDSILYKSCVYYVDLDGGKNPVFQEKYVFTLIEGLREINIVVWNSNTLTFDDFIGSGK